MFDKELFFKLKWLIAKKELVTPETTGSFSFQRAKSNSIIDIHARVSGLHLGFYGSRAKHILDWIAETLPDIKPKDCDVEYLGEPTVTLMNDEEIREFAERCCADE